MKSVCTLLGLSADADELCMHAAVSKLLNRGEIAPDALAALRAEREARQQGSPVSGKHKIEEESSVAVVPIVATASGKTSFVILSQPPPQAAISLQHQTHS